MLFSAYQIANAASCCVDSFGEYRPGSSFSRFAHINDLNLTIYIADPANTTHIIITQSGKAVFKANHSPASGLRIQIFTHGAWINAVQATANNFPPSQHWTFGQEVPYVIH